jgi:hypothetical protein
MLTNIDAIEKIVAEALADFDGSPDFDRCDEGRPVPEHEQAAEALSTAGWAIPGCDAFDTAQVLAEGLMASRWLGPHIDAATCADVISEDHGGLIPAPIG